MLSGSSNSSANDMEMTILDVDQYALTLQEKQQEQEAKQRRRDLKKLKKKMREENDAAGTIVEFIGPSGDTFEMRAWSTHTISKYDVKLAMANERTFFKYLFSGIHTAAISTFLLTCFATDVSWAKFTMLGVVAVITICLVAWGLGGYYQRKSLMEDGVFTVDHLNVHGPAFVSSMFFFLFCTILTYAILTHQVPDKHGGGGAIDGQRSKNVPLNAL